MNPTNNGFAALQETMNEESAKALIAAIRLFGDNVMQELHRLKGNVSEEQFRYWSLAAGRALGAVDQELLSPICREFPNVVPKTICGPADDSDPSQ